MKLFKSLLLFGCSTSILLVSGCGTGSGVSFPNVPVTSNQTPLGTIQGSLYGGHAPLVNAHVYVLEATTNGYGSQVTSLLSATSTSSYPTLPNYTDPSIPTSGTGNFPWYYETTDSTGAFNISGDYTCTEGDPVYLYAYGGSPTSPVTNNTFQFNSGTVSNLTGTGGGETATYTVNLTTSGTFAVGEQVTFTNLSGEFTQANGTVAFISAVNSPTSISIVQEDPDGTFPAGTYQNSGTVTVAPGFNPEVVNLAMLGICPSSGNFSTGGTLPNGTTFKPLQYVYINEVSTVAMAYAMAGFGNGAYTNDAIYLGSDAGGLTGLQNAATNASTLFNVQGGGPLSTSFNGEGHIANATTVGGNGTVPQTELDTLADILAACVDSNVTTNSSGVATLSAQCTTLQLGASSTGGLPPGYNASNYANNGTTLPSCTATSGIGTQAANTAQAAFNIAHFPETPCVTALYTLPTGTVPFTPHLTAQPNDFTVAITYASTTVNTVASISQPIGIAIDANGNAFVGNEGTVTSYVTEFSPTGVLLAPTSAKAVATVGSYLDALAIDPSGYVWATLPGANIGTQLNPTNGVNGDGYLYKFTNGSTAPGLSTATAASTVVGGPEGIAIDSNGTVYMTQCDKYANTGTWNLGVYTASGGLTQLSVGGDQCPEAVSIGATGGTEYVYFNYDANAYNIIKTSGTLSASGNGLSNNYGLAADSSGNGWFSTAGQTNVYKAAVGGGTTAYGKGTGNDGQNSYVAGLDDPTWTVLDGSGNVFILNNNGTSSSVSELSNAGAALSCPTCLSQGTLYGYQKGNISAQTSISAFGTSIAVGMPAMDSSGDLWIPNYGANTVTEIIGVGTPVSTPLSLGKYGTTP